MVRLAALSYLFCLSMALGKVSLGDTPGVLFLASASDPDFQPSTLKELKTDDPFQRRGVLEGLLGKRQSCQSGYGLCSNGRCCPSGGRCCTGGCCNPGRWCYSTGCCDLDENGCEQVSCCPKGSQCCKGGTCCPSGSYCAIADGVVGCCKNGKICTGSSGQCATSSYVKCPGQDFCCPPGDTCFRDSDGQGKCRSSSAPPPPPPSSPSTTPPTPSSFQNIPPTPSAPSLQPSGIVAPKPIPVQSPPVITGSTTTIVTSTDNRINWSSTWQTSLATCNSSTPGRVSSTVGEKVTFQFSGAEAIYIRANSNLAMYRISISGETTTYGQPGDTLPANCTYIWYKTGLAVSRTYSVEIVLLGQIELHNGKRALWSFDFQNFALSAPSQSGNTGGSGGSGTSGSGNDAVTLTLFSIPAGLTVFTIFVWLSFGL